MNPCLNTSGGIPESKRASELSKLLGIQISPLQVVQGHSPFKDFVNRFENELVVAVGKGEPAVVMSEYGFKKVISIDKYSSYFEAIDPLAQYKNWEINKINDSKSSEELPAGCNVLSDRVKGVFVVSDPIDWGRDIQVLCDILFTGGLPGSEKGQQPPIYFANDDFEYQGIFPSERFGMGAFRLTLECIFNRMKNNNLKYTCFGKPNPFVFKTAEGILKHLMSNISYHNQMSGEQKNITHSFNTLYMIGDNPSVDIQGARKAGHPWFSILTRTGVFKGNGNHPHFPADLVVDTVEDAIDFILKKENS
ncbi:Phosphatidyl synthase [Zostera marina]|uniref:Phosphatidyl synthase n=1 Tax=Zostera marina TaxID=29655 RepID=A0A0K9PQI5_ZOSMR|nr:Phosphatidyl synthase [Zostera marina]